LKDYQKRKRALFTKWLQQIPSEQKILLFNAHQRVSDWNRTDQLREFLKTHSTEYCIYLMLSEIAPSIEVPLYIGKSKDVLKRWDDHFNNLFNKQKMKSYSQWWSKLIDQDQFLYNTYLLVISQSKIQTPPIPDFPTSVQSVEYQLIGLASDAYAEYLLNQEGNRR
jgi:hypothetical protein